MLTTFIVGAKMTKYGRTKHEKVSTVMSTSFHMNNTFIYANRILYYILRSIKHFTTLRVKKKSTCVV